MAGRFGERWRVVRILGLSILLLGLGVGALYLIPAGGRADVPNPRAASSLPTWQALRAGGASPREGPNVLLISIDTLRADHMSLYGYTRPTTPHIDRFARRARVFARAYATTPFTTPSIVSMLTGLYPYRHGVRLLWQRVDDHVITIADHLHCAGYRTAAVISNIVLTEQASGLGARFDDYDAAVDEPEPNRPEMFERRAARTTDAALAWLRESKPATPFFLWVHYIDPHGPYTPPEDAPAHFHHDTPVPLDPQRIAAYVRDEHVTDGAEYVDRYDEEIAYVDREIGRLLDAFADAGLADDALIILTADHGEQLMDGETLCFSHGFDVTEAVLRIPLLVRYPSLSAERVIQPVSLADIMPTILEVAGVTIPDDLDGRGLAGAISTRPPYAEGRDSGGSGGLRRALIYPDRKVVVQHGRSNEPRRRWAIDVPGDPGDLHPLPVDVQEPAYIVLAELIRSDPDPGGIPPEVTPGSSPSALVTGNLDDDAVRKLKALGYVN